MRSALLNASAYLLPSCSVAQNQRLSMRRKPPFKLNINRPMPRSMGNGFLSVPLSRPPPKNRNGLSSLLLLLILLFSAGGRRSRRIIFGNVTADIAAACGATAADFTLRVTDSGGLFAEATLHVAVTAETTPPVIMGCPSDVTVYPGPGRTTCEKQASWTPPTASDNCTLARFTSNHNPGDTFPVGNTM